MKNNNFKMLSTSDLQDIIGGDNESYDFWYRVGRDARKTINNVGKAICGAAPWC